MTLEIRNLSLQRGGRLLQKDIDFTLEAGESLWVQGMNGVGKSTLLEVICGLHESPEGEILWVGKDIRDDKDIFHENLAFIGHKNANAQNLTLFESLEFYAHLFGSNENLNTVLERLDLSARSNVPVHMLSAGQKKRLALARLLLKNAKLWILDEPAVSLDFAGVNLLCEFMHNHVKTGGILIYTSHVSLELSARQKKIELNQINRNLRHTNDGFLGKEWDDFT